MPTLPITEIEKEAWEFAKKAHEGVFRKFSNSSYFDGHVAKVYGILKQYDTRPALGVACLCHDILEDTSVTYDMLRIKFGARVAKLVKEVTSSDEEVSKQGKANYLLNKMIGMSSDALIIKLCDRFQNISDIFAASPTFRKKYYKETTFILDGLKKGRRLTSKHNRIISQIDALLENVANRNNYESNKYNLKYLKLFDNYNEGIKSTIGGIGLAASLLTTNPISANIKPNTYQNSNTEIGEAILKVNKLSEIRKSESRDAKLDLILDEIKSKINSNDTTKLKDLFYKLSDHIHNFYGYEINNTKIESSIIPTSMSLFEILGWLGSICLAICGIPQAWQSIKDRNSNGVSWSFVLLWAFGEMFALAYVYKKLDLPLLLNYATNILTLGIIIYFKMYPRRDVEDFGV